MRRVIQTDGCWEWQGCVNNRGYGTISTKRGQSPKYVHRVSYEEHVGPIPEGLVLDHLCENTICVRPDHLDPVTQDENARRTWERHPEQAQEQLKKARKSRYERADAS